MYECLSASMYVHHMHAVLEEARKGHGVPRNWNCRWLVLGTELRSLAKTVSILSHWFTSPAPYSIFYWQLPVISCCCLNLFLSPALGQYHVPIRIFICASLVFILSRLLQFYTLETSLIHPLPLGHLQLLLILLINPMPVDLREPWILLALHLEIKA